MVIVNYFEKHNSYTIRLCLLTESLFPLRALNCAPESRGRSVKDELGVHRAGLSSFKRRGEIYARMPGTTTYSPCID